METIRLEHTIEEANVILAALGQQPFVKVADLIHKIQKEATAQLNRGSDTVIVDAEEIEMSTLKNEENGK